MANIDRFGTDTIKDKYMMDRFNMVRQESNLIIDGTEWWLDESAPWIANSELHDNDAVDFCDMLLNDGIFQVSSDFDALQLINKDAFNFLNCDKNENEHEEEEKKEEEKKQELDDTTTISDVSDNNAILQLPVLPDDLSINDLFLGDNNNHHLFGSEHNMITTPNTDKFMSPPIIGSIIEIRKNKTNLSPCSQISNLSPLMTPNSKRKVPTAWPLV
eukprot:TRINITY_DN6324_c0_g1_i1.p1 TRINITY_DN6324_c0_g1~~TRINITY_DN6324_c0_g1_i1.p1  ORF type:complete len:216 (-),score=30.27 TRINITY_DN6324_c0_g1_i1:27-674(-)